MPSSTHAGHGEEPLPPPPARRLRIGDSTIEPDRFVLERRGRTRRLEPKVMSVLLALAAEPGRVVSRDELLARVWGERFVTEEVLTRAVSLLRRAMGDDRHRPRYIETIRQGGYRLVAGVEALSGPGGATAGPAAEAAGPERGAELEPAALSRAPARRRSIRAAAAIGATTVGLSLAMLVSSGDPRPEGHGAPAVAASREYQEGRYHLSRRSLSGYQQAAERFHAALAADPLDATTHAALAETYFLLGFYRSGAQPVPLAMERARAAARRALDLHPRQAHAHAVLGTVAWTFDYDLETGARHLRAALESQPGLATAHQWLSWLLMVGGHGEAAEAELARAAELDPLSAIIATARGTQALIRGDHDHAERLLLQALELDPGFARAHLSLGLAHEARGELDLALERLERASVLMEHSVESRAAVAHCRARRGERALAEAALAELAAAAPASGYSAAFEIALLHEALGRRSRALAWVAEGLDRRTLLSYSLLLDPRIGGLRRDPRFEALLASRLPQLQDGRRLRAALAAFGDPRSAAVAHPPGIGPL